MVLKSLMCVLSAAAYATANVEKAIFLGPQTVNIPLQRPSLDDLHIDALTPSNLSLRTHVEAEFPRAGAEKGKATWLLLDGLTPGQRYEARVCWAATQPTAFTVETYELPTVWETPELMASLYEYSMSRQQTEDAPDEAQQPRIYRPSEAEGAAGERVSSVLFLQILAAADYFSANKTLMETVPPVYVDIILDPFFFNVLPQSLLPTVGYIVVIAVISLVLSQKVVAWIQGYIAYAQSEEQKEKKQQ